MSAPATLALLGGPESGKTTYLGALIEALARDQIPRLRLGRTHSDTSDLDRLVEPLLEGRYYPHTAEGGGPVMRLRLRTRGEALPADRIDLEIADYKGEEVERLFQTRTGGWSERWQARATADGLLLLLRPDAVQPLPRLVSSAVPSGDRWRVLRKGAEAAEAESPRACALPAEPGAVFGSGLTPDEAPQAPPVRVSDPGQVPTTLALIELLQFIRHARGLASAERPARGTFRVGVLVAAWDALDPAWRRSGPSAYLEQEAALLEDFLWSNFHSEDVHRFGLSSTGGDLHDEAYRERYLAQSADARPFVAWNDATGAVHGEHDLGLPLCWALYGDPALPPA